MRSLNLQKKQSRRRRRSEVRLGRAYEQTIMHEELPVGVASRPRTRLGPKASSLLLAIALALLIAYGFASDGFYVYEALVLDNSVVSADEIYLSSGVDGYSIFIEPRQVEEAVRALPDIRDVEVQLGLPCQVTIEVQERQARVMWQSGEDHYGLDDEGRVLSLPPGVEPPILIRDVDGTPRRLGERVDPNIVAAAEAYTALLPGLREFDYSQEYGLSIVDQHGWPVRLGDGEAANAKVAVMKALANALESQNLTVEFIDLRFPASPYYRATGG
jgi:cell division septal protein FtsQ